MIAISQKEKIITVCKGGFPHSEISGSKVVRTSSELIAAYHVFHSLCAPRHPLNALITLDSSDLVGTNNDIGPIYH